MNYYYGIIVSVVVLMLLAGCTSGPTGNVVIEPPREDAVRVEFYVMSQCPYGVQVVDAITPVLKQLGGAVDFQMDFIARDNGDGTFSSLHGEPEVQGNIVQLCAAQHEPEKYLDMIACQNKAPQNIPGNWEACAQQHGLDVESIRTCYEGAEGKELLSASVARADAAGAEGSPTMFINGEGYAGARRSDDFMRAICNAIETDKPEACLHIPEPTKVNVIVLNDERCTECDVSRVLASLKALFPGLNVVPVEYATESGQEIYDNAGVTMLPALLFDETINEADGYNQVQRYLREAGEYQSLVIGAQFDPTKEICTNEKDDTGNSLIDCADPDCADTFDCREEIENHVEVFIMSDCPYGRKAIEALKGAVDNFGDDLTWDVHYIAVEQGDGFQSLHGQYEVDENIVQLCVKEHSPDVWLDYLYCRSTNGVEGIDWKTCAQETGVDVDAVDVCFTGDEGADLLREDIKIGNEIGVGASPTWVANNKYVFSGIDAETVKQNVCSANEGLEGCDNTLSADTGGVPAGQC